MEYNKQQKDAIFKRGGKIKNILVSAGAGSGKTAVLAERVTEMVCNTENNINIDNLLIMTFTKNAASEMRERIAGKLKERRDRLILSGGNAEEIINIKNQLSLLNKANITTIDSFCNNVVRQYFYKVDIDPGYRIAGDDSCQELAKLISEAMDEIFEEKLTANDSDFLMLMEYFCPKRFDDENLREIIFKINRILSSVPYPEKWLGDALSYYDSGNTLMSDKMLELIKRYITHISAGGKAILDNAFALINDIDSRYSDDPEIYLNKKYVKYKEVFNQMREMLSVCIYDDFDYMSLYNLFNTPLPALSGGKAAAPDILADVFEKLKDYKALFKKQFYDKISGEIFAVDPDTLNSIIKEHYNLIRALFALLREINTRYGEKKNELSLASFSDINHYCIKILLNDDGTPTPEALEYRSRFAEIIVDEYQDNNTLQEYILSALSFEKDNLFMVGDIKQSIYKFRHANPDIFAQKYNSFNKDDLSKGDICIRLNANYRSRKSVLDFVNLVFYQLMRLDFGGIEYTAADALNAGAKFPPLTGGQDAECNELILCRKANDNEAEFSPEIASLKSDEIEAHIIARRISELVDENNPTMVFDSKLNDYRPCRLSDIAILMRSSNKPAHIYISILSRYGIPTVTKSSYSLFDELEVKTVMALLKVLDNPYNDKELITILHSPVFNISCAELTLIKLVDKKGAMFDNLAAYINTFEDELSAKLKGFISFWEQIRELALIKPFCEVLDTIYRMTDYMNYIGMIRNGKIRMENLKILSSLAGEIYNSGICDFGGIVKGLCDIEKENPEYESSALSDFDNAVQIMSIHKSKGLEFPIVFFAQLNKNLQSMNKDNTICLDSKMGIAFNHFDTKTRIQSPFMYKTVLNKLAEDDSLTEELRLLYVALTRAKEKLIMVGVVNNFDDSLAAWQQYSSYNAEGLKLPAYAAFSSKSYLDWIMKAYYRAQTLNAELEKYGIDTIPYNDIIKIDIKALDDIKTDELDISRIRELFNRMTPQDAPEKERTELSKRLLSDYLDSEAVILPSKISISEIKRQHQVEAYKQLEYDLSMLDAPSSDSIAGILTQNKQKDTSVMFDEPEFLSNGKKPLTAAQRGTAYHTVFEHLILKADANEEFIKSQLDTLREKNILSEEEYKCINAKKIVEFLQSPLGKRICASPEVHREAPFVMQLSPSEVFSNGGYDTTDAKILVHGIIDLYFEENDYIILVDYKTDKVDDKNTPEVICDRYRIQLDYYKRAIELSSGKKVKQAYLYLISSGEAALACEY